MWLARPWCRGSTPVDRQPLLGRSPVLLPDTDADLREVLQEDVREVLIGESTPPPRAGSAAGSPSSAPARGTHLVAPHRAGGHTSADLAGLLTVAPAIGAGIGLVTPLAFAALAAASPPEPMDQTSGRSCPLQEPLARGHGEHRERGDGHGRR